MRLDTEEIVDQLLHIGSAAVAMFLLTSFGIHVIISGITVMGAALFRELYQHGWQFKAMGSGSYRDLFFFFVGTVIGGFI